jgi:hypothetical protein
VAVPRPEDCLVIAAGQLNAGLRCVETRDFAEAEARAQLARGYLALAVAQDYRVNPEDAASWSSGDQYG